MISSASSGLLDCRRNSLLPVTKAFGKWAARFGVCFLTFTLALASCSKAPVSEEKPAPPQQIWTLFSGTAALEHVKWQVQIGPRPAGSESLEKTRRYLSDCLKANGWQVQRQAFTATTPQGPVEFVNLIARFGATTPDKPRAIVCTHYDTKLYDTISFVGANDGASSTGAVVELARVLSLDPELASQVELVFFDGEEAFQQFSESDGTYGSRHYANELNTSGRNRQFQFAILWDMIGDKDLTITLSPDSPSELVQGIFESASALGHRQHFSFHDRPIWDDHVPLNQCGIPAIDLIDFDYPVWHTADDTLEQLSPVSLEKIGAVTLHYLKKRLSLAR